MKIHLLFVSIFLFIGISSAMNVPEDAQEEIAAQHDDEGVACAICRDAEENQDFVTLPCGHRFHRICLRPWINAPQPEHHDQQFTCPTCRRVHHYENLDLLDNEIELVGPGRVERAVDLFQRVYGRIPRAGQIALSLGGQLGATYFLNRLTSRFVEPISWSVPHSFLLSFTLARFQAPVRTVWSVLGVMRGSDSLSIRHLRRSYSHWMGAAAGYCLGWAYNSFMGNHRQTLALNYALERLRFVRPLVFDPAIVR